MSRRQGSYKAHHDAAWTGVPLQQSRALVKAAAAFMADAHPWTVFVTPIFVRPRPDASARLALDRFFRVLAREVAKAHVPYVVGEGRHASGGLHFHVMLDVATAVPLFAIDDAWRRVSGGGNCQPELIRSSVGVAGYMARHESWEPPGVACPRWPACRRSPGGGCTARRTA